MEKDVSIIIVNYCSAELVIEAVQSIIRETTGVSYEIIIVDNASLDGSGKELEVLAGTDVRLIEAEKNLGFGKANNLGVSYAKGEYLFFLNPDTVLMNNAIYVLWDYLRNHSKVGVAGGNLYSPDGNPLPSYCMRFDSIRSEKHRSTWRSIIAGKIKDKTIQLVCLINRKPFKDSFNYSSKNKRVAYVFGADMMISKKLFDEEGGFDPDFFMYAEEEELSWRIAERGYSIVSIPKAKIIHLEGATSKESDGFPEKTFCLRMHGAMTYFLKRYGLKGVKAFYHYRSLYYHRLIRLARFRKKDMGTVAAVQMEQLLKAEYRDFTLSHKLITRG